MLMRESAEQRPRLIQTVQRLEGVGLWGGWWGEIWVAGEKRGGIGRVMLTSGCDCIVLSGI